MNTYKAFYNDKTLEVQAETSLAAQRTAAAQFKLRENRQYLVTVVLTAKDDTPVVHKPLM